MMPPDSSSQLKQLNCKYAEAVFIMHMENWILNPLNPIWLKHIELNGQWYVMEFYNQMRSAQCSIFKSIKSFNKASIFMVSTEVFNPAWGLFNQWFGFKHFMFPASFTNSWLKWLFKIDTFTWYSAGYTNTKHTIQRGV